VVRAILLSIAFLLAALSASADLQVWVDADGTTHVTDDPEKIPPELRDGKVERVEELRALWEDGVSGPPLVTPPGSSSSEEDRVLRELRGALDDLRRGETARATASLRNLLRRRPNHPEAHWYLAILEGRRGHLDAAEQHLRAFLSVAGEQYEGLRASARKRLARLEDERRLLELPGAGTLRLIDQENQFFRVHYHEALLRVGTPDFTRTVLRYLGDARAALGRRLGVFPEESVGVVLYGKAAYLKTHGHRFSFQTVGFFDGRIHVVSAAYPAGELRTLLFHEYTHALFREQTAGDRPFWLNEGLAELSERASNRIAPLTRGERSRLRRAIEAGDWIPLRRIAPSFDGLGDERVRLAYLVSTAAAAWIETHTDREGRARLLRRLGEGWADDEALNEAAGMDTEGIDASLRAEILSEFPPGL
jgi:hypothetical protein